MTTQEFIARIASGDDLLTEKLQACKNPEEAYAVAKDAGLTDSFDELVAGMTEFYESVKELSDEDLDSVAGGVNESAVVTVTTGVIVTLTAGVAAAGAFV